MIQENTLELTSSTLLALPLLPITVAITSVAVSAMHQSVWCPSVRSSVPSVFLTSIRSVEFNKLFKVTHNREGRTRPASTLLPEVRGSTETCWLCKELARHARDIWFRRRRRWCTTQCNCLSDHSTLCRHTSVTYVRRRCRATRTARGSTAPTSSTSSER